MPDPIPLGTPPARPSPLGTPFTPPGGTTVESAPGPVPRLTRPDLAKRLRTKAASLAGGADPYVHLSDDALVDATLARYPVYHEYLRPPVPLPGPVTTPRATTQPPPTPSVGAMQGPPRMAPDPRTGVPVAEVRPGESVFDIPVTGIGRVGTAAPKVITGESLPGQPPDWPRVRALNETIGGAMDIGLPAVAGAAVANLPATAAALGVGTLVTEAGRYIAGAVGAPEPIAELAGNVTGLAAGGVAAERVSVGQGQRARLADLTAQRAARYTEGPPTREGVRPPHRAIATAAAEAEGDRISLDRAEAYATAQAAKHHAEVLAQARAEIARQEALEAQQAATQAADQAYASTVLTPPPSGPVPEQPGLNLKARRQPGRVPTRPIQGVSADSISQAPGGAESTLQGKRGQGRLRDLPENIEVKVPPEAFDDARFMAAASKAVEEGYQGSPGELYRRYQEEVEKAGVLNELTDEHGPQTLLQDIARAGGIGDDARFPGEIAKLREDQDVSTRLGRVSKKTGKIGKDSKWQTGGLEGVKGVLPKEGGLSLDHMAEALRQDPKYRHLLGPNELLDAISEARVRLRKGQASPIEPDLKFNWWQRTYEQDRAAALAEQLASDRAETLSLSELENYYQDYLQLFGPGGEGGPPIRPDDLRWAQQEGLFGEPTETPAARPPARPGPETSPDAIAERMREKLARGEPLGSPGARAAAEARGRVEAAKAGMPKGEEQPPLPGAESVRDVENPTPPLTEAPFGLTPPPPKPAGPPTAAQRPGLFDRLKTEEGVLILDVPPGDPIGLRRWLTKQEAEHGDSAWYHRVEQALDDGNHLRAFRLAAAASSRSIAAMGTGKLTPEEKAAIKGTEFARMTGRTTTIGQTPDVVKPPPVRPGQVGTGIKAGPTSGGILRPPPIRKPLNQYASDLLLGRTHIENLIAKSDPSLVTLVEGNKDTAYRLFRQMADQTIQGLNSKEAKQYLKLSDAEIAGHFERAISESARNLAALSHWVQNNHDAIKFLRPTRSGELKFAGPGGQFMSKIPDWMNEPVRIGKGREVTPGGVTPDDRTLDVLAERGASLEKLQAIWAITQPNPQQVGKVEAVENLSRAFMVSQVVTAIRNLGTQGLRYGTMILDDALAGVFASAAGDRPGTTARLTRAQELLKAPFRPGTATKRPWAESLQAMFDYTADTIDKLPAKDTRKLLAALEQFPSRTADFLGYAASELDTMAGGTRTKTTGSKFLDDLAVDPTLRNYLTLFNRGQEFSIRATVYDATMRAQLIAKGYDPAQLLKGPLTTLFDAVPREALDEMIGTSVWTALDATFASKPLTDSIPGKLLQTFARHPLLLRLGYPFPRFNLLAAPRFIYDHSPAALLDLLAYPFERGRLFRGTQAGKIQSEFLPEVLGKRQSMEQQFGRDVKAVVSARRELQVRKRLLLRAEKHATKAGRVPGTGDPVADAQAALQTAVDAVEAAKATMADSKSALGDLRAQEKTLRTKISEAQQIGAPTLPDYWARMATGSLVSFGAALTLRANQRDKGTEWYEYKWDRGDGSSTLVDLRSFAPFVQYLFPADVLLDLHDHVDWDAVRQEMPQGIAQLNPTNYLPVYNAVWDHYDGKYTSEKLSTEFAQAFFSMSRAAGTTLTITDLLTKNGWPGPTEIGQALVGSLGQFLARFTIPLSQGKAVVGLFDPEENKARIAPDISSQQPFGPLAAPLANVPYASRLIPETTSQTSGEPLASRSPLARQLTGITERTRTVIEAEFKRTGVAPRTIYVPRTGDQGMDDEIARTYAALLQQQVPRLLALPQYQALSRSPASQRDLLGRVIGTVKRAALAQVKMNLGPLTVAREREGPEERRTRIRRGNLLKMLEENLPQVIEAEPTEPTEPPEPAVPEPPPTRP